MVWIGGELQDGTAAVVETLRPNACEAVIVAGSAKRLCTPVLPLVDDTREAVSVTWFPVVR